MERLTDQKIITGCINGDAQIQEEFVKRFSDPIYRAVQYAFRSNNIFFSQADVDDLHNTIFVRLFEERCRKLRQFRGDKGCSLHTWIRLIAVRTVIDYIRKKGRDALSRKKEVLPLEAISDMKADSQEPSIVMEEQEQYRLLEEGMKDIKTRYQLFIKLHFFKGLTINEAADIIGISMDNAYSLKHRAIKQLKSKIAQNRG
ncbi:MAG: RNA polymerase sigma factor [bacterium]